MHLKNRKTGFIGRVQIEETDIHRTIISKDNEKKEKEKKTDHQLGTELSLPCLISQH